MNEKQTEPKVQITCDNAQIVNGNGIQVNHGYHMRKEEVSPIREEPVVEDIKTSTVSEFSIRFAIYINKVEARERYMALLRACRSATEVGKVVATMVQETPGLTIGTAKSESFITILIGLATSVPSGLSVPNFRKAIENAWYAKKD